MTKNKFNFCKAFNCHRLRADMPSRFKLFDFKLVKNPEAGIYACQRGKDCIPCLIIDGYGKPHKSLSIDYHIKAIAAKIKFDKAQHERK